MELLQAPPANPNVLTLRFPRAEIEAGQTDAALGRLRVLTDSSSTAIMYANHCVWDVSGYDNDWRELYEIPECRRFFKRLANEWDGWGHFLEKEFGSLTTFMQLLLDVHVVHRDDSVTTVELARPDQVAEVAEQLLGSMTSMYERLHLGDSALNSMSNQVTDAIRRTFCGGHPASAIH